jgi:hypothetical protein
MSQSSVTFPGWLKGYLFWENIGILTSAFSEFLAPGSQAALHSWDFETCPTLGLAP